MAGIGFSLERLREENTLNAFVRLALHAAMASCGPWLVTIVALGGIVLVGRETMEMVHLRSFKVIVIYNFAFSLILSAPVFMVATRRLADSMHRRDVSDAIGLLTGAAALLLLTQAPLATWFYLGYARLPLDLALLAIAGFFLVSLIWLFGVFVAAMQGYGWVTLAFGLGMGIAFAGAWALGGAWGTLGLLAAFTLGLAITVGLLLTRILAEFPFPPRRVFAFFSGFREYWEIALGGFVYMLAIWIDKFLMWGAPEAAQPKNGLLNFPNYDSAMFLAYLTIVPGMALFLFSAETRFHACYHRFYRDLQRPLPYAKIQARHAELTRCILTSGGLLLQVQTVVALLAVTLAPALIGMIHGHYLQLGMFRLGVLGAMFHVLLLFVLITLSYFDLRRTVLKLQFLFLFANGLFTLASRELGFAWYGYGYFLAALLAFITAAVTLLKHMPLLLYHAFLTTNRSVRA